MREKAGYSPDDNAFFMKPFVFLLLFLMTSAFCSAQYEAATKHYEKGNDYSRAGNYAKAIEEYSLSMKLCPMNDTYFNRALIYRKTGDSCGFCKDLKHAAERNDWEAAKLFDSQCQQILKLQNVPDSLRTKELGSSGFWIMRRLCEPDSILAGDAERKPEIHSYGIYDSLPVFTVVEQMPEFPGGDQARNKFLAENIRYPQQALESSIQGTTYVSFIVEPDGNISHVLILKGIGGGCDEEAIRVIRMLPRWIPGRQNGKAVRVQYNMPVYFKITSWSIFK